MAEIDFPFSKVPAPEQDKEPLLLADLLPGTNNRMPQCIGAVYDRIGRNGLPYYVRSRVMPRFEPVTGLYDTNLGIVTPPDHPRPRARYSQSVFRRLQRGSDEVGSRIFATVYGVTTLVARELVEDPRVIKYVEGTKGFSPEYKDKDVRRAGWRAASRLAIDAVVADTARQEELVVHMREVGKELDWRYAIDASGEIERSKDFGPDTIVSPDVPVELTGSISPFSEAEIEIIFPKRKSLD